jgi:hypothetical protein
VHYVANQPRKAQEHFHAVREAKPDLAGVAVYDRLEQAPPNDAYLSQGMWMRREIESYLSQKATLVAYAESRGAASQGDLFGLAWRNGMLAAIEKVESALEQLGRPSPWGPDLKVSDEFFEPVFRQFFQSLGLPNLMRKTDYHELAPFVNVEDLDTEVIAMLDRIVATAASAKPS